MFGCIAILYHIFCGDRVVPNLVDLFFGGNSITRISPKERFEHNKKNKSLKCRSYHKSLNPLALRERHMYCSHSNSGCDLSKDNLTRLLFLQTGFEFRVFKLVDWLLFKCKKAQCAMRFEPIAGRGWIRVFLKSLL